MANKSFPDITPSPVEDQPGALAEEDRHNHSDDDAADASATPRVPHTLHPNHPMRWPSGLRHWCLLQLAFNALLNGFTSAILIPGTAAVAAELGVSEQRASYLCSVHVLFLGVGPVFWTPVAERCGRRSTFVVATAVSAAAGLGAAYARSYGGLMAARIVQAFGISTGNVFGASVVVELFGREHRGAKLNVWSVMVTCGPGIGALVGGFLIPAKGWRWAMYLNAICCAAGLLAFVVSFPEIQWVKSNPIGLRSRMGFPMNSELRLTPMMFLRPFTFLQSPSMVIMGMVFGFTFGIVSPGLAITLPAVFVPVYHFEPRTVGLVFISYIVGGLLGGQVGGRVGDMLVNRHMQSSARKGQPYQREYRLRVAVLGYFCTIVGILIYGIALQKKVQWAAPVVAWGIAIFGTQIVVNIVNTYCVECHRANSLAVTTFLNIWRQSLGFAAVFWIPPLLRRLNYGLGAGVLAIILLVIYVTSFTLVFRGSLIARRRPSSPHGSSS